MFLKSGNFLLGRKQVLSGLMGSLLGAVAVAQSPSGAAGAVTRVPVPDILVVKPTTARAALMPPSGLFPGTGTPEFKPAVTREALASVQSMPCVRDVSARRLSPAVGLRDARTTGVPLPQLVWQVDAELGISARGWKLAVNAPSAGMYYLSEDLAAGQGLPPVGKANQTVKFVGYLASESVSVNGQPPVHSGPKEVSIGTPTGPVKSLDAPYGGTVVADLSILPRQPAQVILHFVSFIPRASQLLTAYDQWREEAGAPTIYVRMRPGLAPGARAACKSNIEKVVAPWKSSMPNTSWTVEPLQV